MLSSMMPLLAQAAPEAEEIAQAFQAVNFSKILAVVSIIVVAYVVNRTVEASLDRMGEGQAKRRLLFKKISSFSRLGIFVTAIYMIAATLLEGQREAMIGVLGTLGLAIGFAAKDTVSSIMAGILILFDQPFQVGDRVQFGDTYGEVKEIGLRAVRIVTLDDNEVSIPNNKFLTEPVSSSNAGALDMMVVMNFRIATNADFDLAKRLVYEACITSKYVFLNKPVVMELKNDVAGQAFCLMIVCRAYVIDTRYEMAFVTDVTERVRRAFTAHQIPSPFRRNYAVIPADSGQPVRLVQPD